MSADQSARIHRVIASIDSDTPNVVYVLRQALRDERSAGWEEGYTDAMADQYEVSRLVEAREKRAAEEAAEEAEEEEC